jgi:LysM repeat protein
MNFTEDYPKQGTTYTVEPGDTLASIAQRLGSSVRDIQNANKIADPKTLQVGQVIFVPQR